METARSEGEHDDDSARRHGAQGTASRDVGLRRLPLDGGDVPAADRRAARRRVRHRPGHARARRRFRHGQRRTPGRPERCRRHGQRLDPGAARGRPRARRVGGPSARVGRGRRGAPAVRERVLRRRDVRDRGDVRAAPPGSGRRAGARLSSRREDRFAQLDARRHARRALPHDEALRAASPARRAAAAALGRRGAPARPPRRPRDVRHGRAGRARDHRLPAGARLRRALQEPTTGRRSPRARTPSARGGRRSSTRLSTRSARSGTAARPTRRGSRRST